FRSIQMEGKEIEFSEGFTDLHTKSYAEILKGNGFGLAEARQSIELVHEIRNTEIAKSKTSNNHPLLTTL
ncbi:MAG: oxidoreductase, partial [Chryseotalea sp.]